MEPTPHDALFRGIFGQPEHMAAELRAVLPAEVLAQLDLATLAPLPATFIDAALAERHADLLFEVALHRGGHALLYVLVEHQSSRDPWMLLRLLGYELRIWEQWRREHPERGRLPAIVPIVVHHGEAAWSVPLRFEELLDLDEEQRAELAAHLVSFAAIVDDLTMQEPADVAARAMAAVARLALAALQTARDEAEFVRQIALLANLLREAQMGTSGQPSVDLVLRYLFELRDRPEVRELERRAVAEGVDVMAYNTVSWAERERREGRLEGQLEARRQVLRQLCEQRFGALTAEQVATLDACDGARLEAAVPRILTARSFGDLFAA
jgi:predicted transposase/invertase (TIGR01784 family)